MNANVNLSSNAYTASFSGVRVVSGAYWSNKMRTQQQLLKDVIQHNPYFQVMYFSVNDILLEYNRYIKDNDLQKFYAPMTWVECKTFFDQFVKVNILVEDEEQSGYYWMVTR